MVRNLQVETTGHMAVSLGVPVPAIVQVVTKFGIEPTLVINERMHFDGEAREQIVRRLAERGKVRTADTGSE